MLLITLASHHKIGFLHCNNECPLQITSALQTCNSIGKGDGVGGEGKQRARDRGSILISNNYILPPTSPAFPPGTPPPLGMHMLYLKLIIGRFLYLIGQLAL